MTDKPYKANPTFFCPSQTLYQTHVCDPPTPRQKRRLNLVHIMSKPNAVL